MSSADAVIDLEAMREAAHSVCAVMKVLSNPDRLMLLCELAQGERNVGQLQEHLGILQPTLSQQLAVLRDAELVATRREGKSIYYRIASEPALAVMQVLYAQFCGPARPSAARHSKT